MRESPRASPDPWRAAGRGTHPAPRHRHRKGLREAALATGQPGQRRPRAAGRLRGRRRPRRRRPRAPSRRHRRRHRLRQAARPQSEGPRRAARHDGRRPRRRDAGVRRVHRHRRLRHGDAPPRRAHLLHHRRRSVPAAHHARTAGADDAGRDRAPARVQEEPALLRAHREADRVRRQGPHVRAVRRAGRHLPGAESPAGIAGAPSLPGAGLAGRRLGVQRQPAQSDGAGRAPLRDRHPQPGSDVVESARRRALRAAARPRRSLSDLVALLHPLAERGAAVRGVLQGHRRVRRRLAVLLLRPVGREEEAEPGVRRRRPARSAMPTS